MFFTLYKISRSKLGFTNFICTSPALKCKPKNPPTAEHLGKKKNNFKKYFSKNNSNFGPKKYENALTKEEKTTAKKHFEELIEVMKCDSNKNVNQNDKNKKITIPTPKLRLKKNAVDPLDETCLQKAAKDAAADLGGDKKTEEELLSSVKNVIPGFKEPTSQMTINENKQYKSKEKLKIVLEKVHHTLQEINKVEVKSGTAEVHEFCEPKWENQVKMKLWDDLEKEKLTFFQVTPPKNYFEEMIAWTDQGKVWHFPIDNDQGRNDEAAIDFSQHVFLEGYLEPWCPKRGPLRHFMELVLVGLSKNPYLSVEEKKEHIFWFRDYFEDKRKLLQELGAFTSTKQITDSN